MLFDKWKRDTRPPRGGWANGEYVGKCSHCGCSFIGAKRASSCADCAYDDKTECN